MQLTKMFRCILLINVELFPVKQLMARLYNQEVDPQLWREPL